LPDGKIHDLECECTAESESCCQKPLNSERHADTCIDVESNIETDDYQVSQNKIQIQGIEIQLFIQPDLFIENPILSIANALEMPHYYSPPDPIFTSSFLL